MSQATPSSHPHQQRYGWTQSCLTRDGKPWLPVMGEFHYARYPHAYWRDEINKMKACGVDIVASYVFWIHHEETEGRFDFTGSLDLRAFLRDCADEGLSVFLRIGPWCHGEARNGGFPDWLMRAGIPTRRDDPRYLARVRRFWEALYPQAEEAMYRNGGPVIGIQIENEYGHCGGTGESAHMETLLTMARDIGFEAPYYTATGWGGACIGESFLPVMGGYCDAPWDPRLCELPPSGNYIFSHERNDVDIGSDFKLGANVTFDEERYPYLMAEMGGGIGSTFHRRLTATDADTGAMTLVKLGSGANLLGYYMYHGGTNPRPGLNETRESGSYCETPTLSYAPRSPIGEYGQITGLAKELKLFSMFARDFGALLAPMPVTIPQGCARVATDRLSPRYALRGDEQGGFVFVNNHQRGLRLPPKAFDVEWLGRVDVPAGAYTILPVRLPVGGARISSPNAMPLCVLNETTCAFVCDGAPRFRVEGEPGACELVTLTRAEALDAWKIRADGRERLIVASAPVVEDAGWLCFITREDVAWRCVPDERGALHGTLAIPEASPNAHAQRTNVNYQCHDFDLTLRYDGDAPETFLRVAYEGSLAELFVNGEKVADDVYDGTPWEIGLSRFGFPRKAALRVYALFEGMPVWAQNPPAFHDGRALRLGDVTMHNEYRLRWRSADK